MLRELGPRNPGVPQTDFGGVRGVWSNPRGLNGPRMLSHPRTCHPAHSPLMAYLPVLRPVPLPGVIVVAVDEAGGRRPNRSSDERAGSVGRHGRLDRVVQEHYRGG